MRSWLMNRCSPPKAIDFDCGVWRSVEGRWGMLRIRLYSHVLESKGLYQMKTHLVAVFVVSAQSRASVNYNLWYI